jgi:hypothetical protein
MVKLEMLQLEQMLDIAQIAGNEVIHPNHMEPFLYKPVAQMRPEEPGSAGNQHPFLCIH